MTESPQDIIKRLEKLRQWQEEQQKILLERQNSQREMLNMEHQKVLDEFRYSGNSSALSAFNSNVTLGEEGLGVLKDDEKSITALRKSLESPPKVPKRPFLRRGEGLASRFKVDPDQFRLHNLPKYKYANAYRSFIEKSFGKKQSIVKQQTQRRAQGRENPKIAAKSETRAPRQRNLGRSLVLEKVKSKTSEKRFERSPKSSETDSGIQSTAKTLEPDIVLPFEKCDVISCSIKEKLDGYNDSKQSVQASIKNLSVSKNETIASRDISGLQTSEETSIGPVSWAKVLNTYHPIPIEKIRKTLLSSPSSQNRTEDEQDSLSLFELLERKVQEGSVSLNLSSIKQWIEANANSVLDLSENEITISENTARKGISPVPFDIEKKIVLDETDEEEHGSCDEEEVRVRPERGHVRFSDYIEVNEVDSETDTALSNDLDALNTSRTSTPTEKNQFDKFKAAIFGNDSTHSEETTLTEDKRQEIIENSELLKTRLSELENEISSFRTNNAELIKLKQQHELDKIKLQQERIEMEEKLNDERIKIEIYLHDQQMKLEEERKKIEKLQKQPNRKDREEIAKLKEQVETLKKEKDNKESKHCAAQARLRAQIRNLEKEVRDLSLEIEHLKKENKKLDSENMRLNRMNSNKMLQEINKTIAKLAPKVETTEVKNKNPKPVVAKVVSYRRQEPRRREVKSKSVPDLSHEEEIASTSDDSDDSSSERSKMSDIEEQSPYLPINRRRSKGNNHRRSRSGEQGYEDRNALTTEENAKSELKNDSMSKSTIPSIKREIINSDGSKDIWYPNGNLKKISADNMIIRMLYYNKDIKETNISEGTVKYYYAETNTWHTTYLDGLEILEFPNGQTEHRYKDGKIEVHFPNSSIRITNATDEKITEEWRYPDGTTLVQMKNGDKILSMPNGQKEIHTKLHKRREYPDGTVKIVYPDGSQETRYSNGRVRLKDRDGNLVMDSVNSKY